MIGIYINSLRHRGGTPEVVLHVGQHKTGSSAIQAAILANRHALSKRGFYVLRTGQGIDGAHHALIYWLTGQPSRRLSRSLLRAEMGQAFPARLLISSEFAKQVIVAGDGDQLIDALRANGAGKVHLLLYVRSPFGVANATYSEATSSLSRRGLVFADYLRWLIQGSYYRYDRFLELARRPDVELTVRPYDENARRDIVGAFWGALEVDIPVREGPRLNSSFGPVGLEAMRIVAREVGPLEHRQWWNLRERVREVGRSLGEQPFWGIGEGEEALLADADRRTDEFAHAVWGRTWRDVIGEERRHLNVYNPDDPRQRDLLQLALARMRSAATPIVRK